MIKSVGWHGAPITLCIILLPSSRPAGSCMPPQPWTFPAGTRQSTAASEDFPLCVLLNTTLNGSMVSYERYLIQLWHYEKEIKSLLAIKWLIVVFGKCGIKCGSPKNLISVIIYSPSCHSKTAWISFCNTNKDIRQNGSLHHCSLLLHQKKM